MNTDAGTETIVMTVTFRAEATPFLVVRDEHERRLQYSCALIAWSRPARVWRIVFGENSNTAFDFAPSAQLLAQAGEELEVVHDFRTRIDARNLVAVIREHRGGRHAELSKSDN